MSGHTPGPWAIDDCQTELVIHHDKYDVAIVGIDPTFEYNSENRANAKLIAAAPDLAEALRELVAGCHNGVTLVMLDKAESALAKAGVA